ncbi:MAG TPA: sigma-70 family RNA polymerase sigma factor [Polyangiaceae bacterium]|jgi:RNA polymerase sigma-70 factor (ECF subfamily)|nr:sigma-70 family RNA polymerase sigma factor [Polyangiaceae bacterium]
MTEDKGERLDQLMARLADGDRTAFPTVFKRLWPPVRDFCLNLLRNDADASDAAQEAMKKILERAPQYDATKPAMPWVLAIASWECRTIRRRRDRRREGPEGERTDSDEGRMEEEITKRDLSRALITALKTLGEKDQDALIATFWEDEASVSGATLRQRRGRALERLRVTWRKLYGFS